MDAAIVAGMKAESARLKKLAADIDAVIAAYEPNAYRPAPMSRPPPRKPASADAVSMPESAAPPVPADYSKMTQPEFCYDILKKANGPMGRDTIYKLAIEGGAEIISPDHLSPVLSRDKRFEHVGRGFWQLAKDAQ